MYSNKMERANQDIDDDFKLKKKSFGLHGLYTNISTAKLFNLNFHPLEVVSRWRDPQLQVGENYSDLTKSRSTVFK